MLLDKFDEICISTLEEVKKIIEKENDYINMVDSLGRSLLFYSKLNISKYLIKKGIDIDKKDKFGNTALILNDHVDVYKYLIKSGAAINHINDNKKNVLFYSLNNIEKTKYLISKGIDLSKIDIYGRNALCYTKNKEVSLLLLKNGINIDLKIMDNDEMISLMDFLKKYHRPEIYIQAMVYYEENLLKEIIKKSAGEKSKKRI